MPFDYDIIAVGGGAAGLVTAAGAAGLGARSALVERHRMGGECLWTGCVPSKALLACARAAADARAAGRYGVDTDVSIDFGRVMSHVQRARNTIAPHDSPERFRSLGVDVLEGEARFVSERTLRIGNRTISGRHIVLATGSRPAIPEIPGLRETAYHTNETIFDLTELPASMVVLGGGPIGIELAQAFALLGSRVTLIEAGPRILPGEDAQLSALLEVELRRAGIDVKTSCQPQRIAGRSVHTSMGTISADELLVATGREAVLDTVDLHVAGARVEKGLLILNEKLQTTAKNVWAAGDVTGGPRFTHVADYQARTVIRNALFPASTSIDYRVVPRVTYAMPELASVGLTEHDARQKDGNVQVFHREFSALDRGVADGRTTGFLKIVADGRGRILGAHVLGDHASAIIAEMSLAMREKIPLTKLSSLLHPYPTYAEAVKHAADAYVRTKYKGFAKRLGNWLVRRM